MVVVDCDFASFGGIEDRSRKGFSCYTQGLSQACSSACADSSLFVGVSVFDRVYCCCGGEGGGLGCVLEAGDEEYWRYM